MEDLLAALARMLANAAKRVRFTTCPEQHKPTPSVEVHMSTRDRRCRFPGCFEEHEQNWTLSHGPEHPESGGQTIPEKLGQR
ncbi:MAG: hypothetical protein ACRC20_11995 [Segniliparus sp.]|uniref:hypothetical protein n=1 Tax=Segniliparus sp. TaxID=2804064 RepID=UPI003F2EE65D